MGREEVKRQRGIGRERRGEARKWEERGEEARKGEKRRIFERRGEEGSAYGE